MGARIGKKTVGLIVGRENLTPDLNNQDRLLDGLEDDITRLPEMVINKLPFLINRSITEITANDFEDISEITEYVFYGCRQLQTLTIPEGITKIGSSAVRNCGALTEINLPSTLRTVSSYAFMSSGSSAKVNIPSIKDWCNITFSTGEANPLSQNNNQLYVNGELITELKSTDLQESNKIPSYAFYNYQLTKITIPSSITKFDSLCFANNTNLLEVIFEGQAPSISRTFEGCTSVTKYDFSKCTSIPTLSSTGSLGHADGCTIILPFDLYDEWLNATNWGSLYESVSFVQAGIEIPEE